MATICFGCMKQKKDAPVCEHCGYDERQRNEPHCIPAGAVLHGQYLVGRVLGQGGFGITYMGWDMYLDQPLAIKEFFPISMAGRDTTHSLEVSDYSKGRGDTFSGYKRRFLTEAQTLARLRHLPQIVHVLNFFEEYNTAYIVMEYVDGMDLRKYQKQLGRPLSAGETLSILDPVMDALSQVHAADLIHRDISPDNMMLLPDGSIKLLDFGAAKVVENADTEGVLSVSTQAIMKPGFAPLEQYQSRGALGPWTDVYAMCATIYYCMTGQVPPEAMARLMENREVNWSLLSGLSQKQIAALQKGMALLPKDRYQSMEELRQALMPKKKPAPKAAPKPAARKEPPKVTAVPKTAEAVPAQEKPKEAADTPKKKGKWWLVPVALLAAAACGLFFLSGRTGETTPAPTAAAEIAVVTTVSTEPPVMTTAPDLYAQAEDLLAAGEKFAAAKAFYALGDEKDARARCFAIWDEIAERHTIATGGWHTVGVRTDGTVAVAGQSLDWWNARMPEGKRYTELEDWSKIIAVAAADFISVGLRSDGTVVAVGETDSGQCNVGQWRDIVAIWTDGNCTMGLKADGTVLATNTEVQKAVSGWTDIIAISGDMGLKADGTVVCTGETNPYRDWTDIIAISEPLGLRADGTVAVLADNRNYQEISQWRDVVAICCGDTAIKEDGTLLTVGGNYEGRLVDGPQYVSRWKDIVDMSYALRHAVGLKADGTVVASGNNFAGRISGTKNWDDILVP